ncbi:unnamed protein product [Lampetra fluviatilis]
MFVYKKARGATSQYRLVELRVSSATSEFAPMEGPPLATSDLNRKVTAHVAIPKLSPDHSGNRVYYHVVWR